MYRVKIHKPVSNARDTGLKYMCCVSMQGAQGSNYFVVYQCRGYKFQIPMFGTNAGDTGLKIPMMGINARGTGFKPQCWLPMQGIQASNLYVGYQCRGLWVQMPALGVNAGGTGFKSQCWLPMEGILSSNLCVDIIYKGVQG